MYQSRFVATSNSFQTISVSYRMGISTIQEIVRDIAEAIWDIVMPEVMPPPRTPAEWNRIANRFERKWQFPNCCDALDGKHCTVIVPPNSRSLYWNYKRTFSVILTVITSISWLMSEQLAQKVTPALSRILHLACNSWPIRFHSHNLRIFQGQI